MGCVLFLSDKQLELAVLTSLNLVEERVLDSPVDVGAHWISCKLVEELLEESLVIEWEVASGLLRVVERTFAEEVAILHFCDFEVTGGAEIFGQVEGELVWVNIFQSFLEDVDLGAVASSATVADSEVSASRSNNLKSLRVVVESCIDLCSFVVEWVDVVNRCWVAKMLVQAWKIPDVGLVLLVVLEEVLISEGKQLLDALIEEEVNEARLVTNQELFLSKELGQFWK